MCASVLFFGGCLKNTLSAHTIRGDMRDKTGVCVCVCDNKKSQAFALQAPVTIPDRQIELINDEVLKSW